jgi:hypothetical protein
MNTTEPETTAPPVDEYLAAFAEWQKIKQWQEQAKAKEQALRQKLIDKLYANKLTAAGCLPEGTTKSALPVFGGELVATVSCSYERKVLEESLSPAVRKLVESYPEDQREQAFAAMLEKLVRRKPELAKAEWNKLTDEEKAIFDEALSTKPGSPQLSVTFVPAT